MTALRAIGFPLIIFAAGAFAGWAVGTTGALADKAVAVVAMLLGAAIARFLELVALGKEG